MRKNIWMINHYAGDMFFNKGGRHYWFAQNLRKNGYSPVIFCCNTKHDVLEKFFESDELFFEKCAEESFDCVMCGVCSARCPAGISHPQVAMLARRINGKYLAPGCGHLEDRVKEIKDGDFNELIEALMQKPIDEMKELYNNRDIEK